MSIKPRIRSLPFLLAAGSFGLLVVTSLATNPLNNVAYVIFFLAVLFIFLTSLGNVFAGIHSGEISKTGRYKIVLVVFSVILAIMLRSINSLGGVEALLLLGLTLIVFFWLGRGKK